MLSAERALFMGGVHGYTLTQAERVLQYPDLLKVTITTIFNVPLSKMQAEITERERIDASLRAAFARLPETRFVCVDSVNCVSGMSVEQEGPRP